MDPETIIEHPLAPIYSHFLINVALVSHASQVNVSIERQGFGPSDAQSIAIQSALLLRLLLKGSVYPPKQVMPMKMHEFPYSQHMTFLNDRILLG